jgi:hypothetical protein
LAFIAEKGSMPNTGRSRLYDASPASRWSRLDVDRWPRLNAYVRGILGRASMMRIDAGWQQ